MAQAKKTRSKAKSKAKKKPTKKQQQQQEKQLMMITGLIGALCAFFAFLRVGFLGTFFGNLLRIIGGNTFPILAVVLFLYCLVVIIKNVNLKMASPRRVAGAAVFYVGILVLLHARLFAHLTSGKANVLGTTWDLLAADLWNNRIEANVGGGMIGAVIYNLSYFLVSQIGSYILSVLLIVLGIFLFSKIEFQQVVDWFAGVAETGQGIKARSAERKKIQDEKKEKLAAKKAEQVAKKAEKVEKQKSRLEKAREAVMYEEDELPVEPLSRSDVASDEPVIVPIEAFQHQEQLAQAKKQPTQTSLELTEAEDDGKELTFEIPAEVENVDYKLPTSELLDTIPATDQTDEYNKIEKNIGVLERTFDSFGVDAKVVKASLGPAVTKFEIQPAVGVKVSKIVSLTDDIALALAAKDIRMEAPIPGKSLIGIEVPNSTVSTVAFRDIVEAQPPHPGKLLEVPLGRDISGLVQTADLTKMPHMLIAGSTGSGKSVAINGIITSILMQAKPHQVKLMMIDPKMVELNVYNGIPHLLTPVVTNPRKAAQALHKVVQEMEERYEKFAAAGARNITGYNELVEQQNAADGQKRPILPFIVVIVDELADLMMVASNEVEDAIIRLAQMARAAGIHMILATQRPSVDVITGIIKANVPSRMAFAVSSGTDSRTIIDGNGAEKLLGRGDMLFLPMGENKPIRIQGAFISDHEVERVVKFVTDQQEAVYDEKMMPTDEPTSAPNENPADELYDDAKNLVIEMQTASVSLLQRRFRIGYNRAARIVDELEASGIIGPSVGSKPREVFIQKEPDEETIE